MKFLKRALTRLFPANTQVECNRAPKTEHEQLREAAARHSAFLQEQKQKLETLHAELTFHIARHENPHNIH